jgi:hypothetical protein
MALKASEMNEISTLGSMRSLVDQMEKAMPANREIRKEWLDVIASAKNVVDMQGKRTDSYMSEDDT